MHGGLSVAVHVAEPRLTWDRTHRTAPHRTTSTPAMRRTVPRILALRPPAPRLRRPFGLSALRADWRDNLHKRLWGDNAAAAAAAAAAASTPKAEPEPAPLPLPLAPADQYLESLDARGLRIVGTGIPSDDWIIPAFAPTPPLSDPVALTRAVRRAVIEVHTLLLNAQSTAISSAAADATAAVRVTVAGDGSATLLFPAGHEAAIVAGESTGGHEHEADIEEGWMQMRIAGDVLFDVVRRVVQLTGRRIPDPVVSKVATAADLVAYFHTKPKPAKLSEVLLEMQLADIPNVKVYETRVRPWDKERMVGRERPFEKAVAFRYPFETPAGRV